MSKIALITGGTSGIGLAVTRSLIEKYNFKVIVLGRNRSILRKLEEQYSHHIIPHEIDFSHLASYDELKLAQYKIDYILHSATTLDPLGDSLKATEDDFLYSFKVNTLSVYKIIKFTMPLMPPGARILNISSRAAQSPIKEFAIHCISKATNEALIKTLKLELEPKGILLNNIYPGVVDTPAQARVRGLSVKDYPIVQKFISYKEQGKILTPDQSADFITNVLINSSDTEFQNTFWDFYDTQHWKDI